jgi:hypothetical protein
MQTYQVVFSRTPMIVFVMVVVPLVIVGAFITPLIVLRDIPDWLVITLIVAGITAAIVVSLLLIKHWVTVPAELQMDESGLRIQLIKRSPIYMRKTYSAPWNGLSNVSSNFNPQQGKRFYLISFRNPAVTVSVEPGEITNAERETAFGDVLLGYVASFNSSLGTEEPAAVIRQRGFYDAWWARLITALAWLMMITVVVLYCFNPEAIPVWRLFQVLFFSIIWLTSYYANKRRRKIKEDRAE